MVAEKLNFNNEIITFENINAATGIMYIYILINSRKIRNKDNLNQGYFKFALKDIKNGKIYSSTILSEIKIEYSLNINSKPRDPNKSTYTRSALKQKTANISTLKTQEPENASKNMAVMKRSIRAVTLSTQLRSASDAVRPKRSNALFRAKKIEEKHVDENKSYQQKYGTARKKTVLDNDNNEKEEKREYVKRPQYNSVIPRKTKEKIIVDKTSRKRFKTITTEEIFLEPINYDKYLIENNPKNKNAKHRETFCEGFFIASFPQKDGQVVEKSQSFPSSCGHEECSSLPAMKPEIILRYPLEDTKTLELNNLAATICFPTGIKVCYSEKEPKMIKDYVTPITNQKGERYYMMTYHFYLKSDNEFYSKNYEMHPLKHHLMKFADNYLNMSEDEMDKAVTERIQKDLEQAQELGFRDNVYIPYCICLISKYPYVIQMKKCLQTIYNLIIKNVDSVIDPAEKKKVKLFNYAFN